MNQVANGGELCRAAEEKGFERQRGSGKGEIISKECIVLGEPASCLPTSREAHVDKSHFWEVESASGLDIKSWLAGGRLLT